MSKDANNRKLQETARLLSERNNKIEYEHAENENAKYKLLELDRLKHEENLKDLQKVLQKQNLKELELYQTVKEIEFARRNQEKELENLEKKLETKNKNNAYVVKNMSTNIFTDEEKIRNAIVKEKAHLEKVCGCGFFLDPFGFKLQLLHNFVAFTFLLIGQLHLCPQ
jgi:hypothetical protein